MRVGTRKEAVRAVSSIVAVVELGSEVTCEIESERQDVSDIAQNVYEK